MAHDDASPPRKTLLDRFLDGIERVGNKLPDPAVLFLVMMGLVWVVSAAMDGTSFTLPTKEGPLEKTVISQFTGERLVGFLAEALQRAGDAKKLAVVLTPYFGEQARARFAELDAALPQHAQRLLFGDAAPAASRAPYVAGYRLSPVHGRTPWSAEAVLLSTVEVGALHPLPEDSSRGGPLSLVESWRRFDRLREDSGERELAPPSSVASRESHLFDPEIRTPEAPARERASGPTR